MSIAAVYGLALFGSAMSCVLVLFLVALFGGPDLEMPAWIGSAVVAMAIWVALLLFLRPGRAWLAAASVATVTLALASIVPVDGSWTTSVGIAFITGLCLPLLMWFMSGAQRWLALGESTAMIMLILLVPIVGFAAWQLIESDLVVTWTVVAGLVLAGLLTVVTVVAVGRPLWHARHGWYQPAAGALIIALVVNGVAGLATTT